MHAKNLSILRSNAKNQLQCSVIGSERVVYELFVIEFLRYLKRDNKALQTPFQRII